MSATQASIYTHTHTVSHYKSHIASLVFIKTPLQYRSTPKHVPTTSMQLYVFDGDISTHKCGGSDFMVAVNYTPEPLKTTVVLTP